MRILELLPKEEQVQIVRKHAENMLAIDDAFFEKTQQAKLADMEMERAIQRINNDTEGKLNQEHEFQTGTGKARISARAVQSTSIIPILIVIGVILLAIVLLK